MQFNVITLFPDMFSAINDEGVIARAIKRSFVSIKTWQLRDFSDNQYKNVDDKPYGGGAGMVMTCEPIFTLINELKSERAYDAIIYTTPDGKTFDQGMANSLSLTENLIILCGHYKGVDQRVRDSIITHEITIGDYVLSGGELAAAVISDAIIRLLPGVLNDETSALTDSFQDGLLAPPVYTRPADYKGLKVPDILTGGNLKAIDLWREEQAIERTQSRRPDLLKD